ncbi:hypothetical protein BJ170DRAFT_734784 [Xylariales sp. AK1849]|nr:hypothetical protein BJ170DRAFT_734784 [Xylariales sp. AK1849]
MAKVTTPSLVEQATAILEAATHLQRQLDQHALPQPSFDVDGRKDWHDASSYPALLRIRSGPYRREPDHTQPRLGPHGHDECADGTGHLGDRGAANARLPCGVHKIPEALVIADEASPSRAKVPCQPADSRGRTMWEILEQDDPDGKGLEKFSGGMKSMMAGLPGTSLSHYAQGFDWASLSPGTLIDVGSGSGHIKVNLLQDIPGISFIVQDLPANGGPARALIEEHSAQDRLFFQVHDLFNPQPSGLVPEASCCHSSRPWKTGAAKLLVCERILPDRTGEMANHKEQQLRTQDLLMFTLFGGGERSLSDWKSLFRKADPRLTVDVVGPPLNSVVSFIEVVPWCQLDWREAILCHRQAAQVQPPSYILLDQFKEAVKPISSVNFRGPNRCHIFLRV